MAKQTLIWTALPNGIKGGKLQLSVILSPRLVSDRTRPTLEEFPDLKDWPGTPVEFRVQFAKGPTLPARRTSPPPDSDLWKALFPQNEREFTYVRSYQADRGAAAVISYPLRNLLGYVEGRYRRLALEYPTRLPPASKLLDPEYFGEIRLRGSLMAQLKQVQAQTRREQAAMVAQAMAAAATAAASKQRQDWVHQPITPPPEASTGRDASPLPTGLEEHIRGAIDENRQQVGGLISEAFGKHGQTDGSAIPPDSKPKSRPGEELPDELPIFFPIDTTPDPLRDFLKAGLFYLGLTPELSGDPDDREAQPMPMIPDYDFHQMVSLLLDYPALARRLGIIVDIEVDLTPDVPSVSLCRVLPTWAPKLEATTNVSPWTHYRIQGNRFVPRERPTNPDVRDGMLNLKDRQAFSLVQNDPDSAAIKLLDYVNSGLDPNNPDQPAGLPALRTSGIGVARLGAGILLLQTFVTTRLQNERLETNPDQIAFYAEDLVQGYRPDIWSKETGRWYSLTGRIGTYEFLRSGRTERIEDEGWVTPAASRGVSSAATDMHMHEMMFNWTGWSLAVQSPEPADEDEVDEPQETPLTAMRMRVKLEPPPGSLPILRIGCTYRIRARTVDLAGNSVPFTPEPVAPPERMDEDEPGASQELKYRRLEPVPSPRIIPLAPPYVPPEERGENPPADMLTKGERVNRLVVRTFNNGTYEPNALNPPAGYTEGGATRRLAPPGGSVKQAEEHGIFDTPAGLDRLRYMEAMDHDGDFKSYEPLTDYEPLLVPYCPDPLARYIVFQGLPGWPEDQVYKVELGNTKDTWPYVNTIFIRAEATDEEPPHPQPQFDPVSRVLTVWVPRYGEYEVKVSSGFYPEDLDLFYLWHLMSENLKENGQQQELEPLQKIAEDGRHWMLTPATTLTLVHASQRPHAYPEFITAMAHRKRGETASILSGRVQVHAPSTQSIRVYCTWTEIVDNETQDQPAAWESEGFALEEPVRRRDQNTLEIYHRQDWGDTRHRKVSYYAVATNRFTEYFEPNPDDPTAFQKEGPRFDVDVLSTAPPAPLQVEYIIPTFGWEKPKEDKGTQIVSMRRGGGLRVYLKRPWFTSGEGEMLGVILSDELDAAGRVPEAQRGYVTHWAKDPLWLADAPDPAPQIQHFKNAAAAQRGLEVNGTKVVVVGYPVSWDKERKLWYADIEIDTGRAYFPFIRLALARYQPKSVEGCHLSDVVLTDFLQVVPDRATSVEYISANELRVTVAGETYVRGPAGPAVVEVTVEYTHTADDTIDWKPCEGLLPVELKRGVGFWSGTVILPDDKDGRRFRLIVSEYEQYAADPDPEKPGEVKIGRRLVFADVLEV